MSHKRTLLFAIALGFVAGFSFVAVANVGGTDTAAGPVSAYSAAG
jgi:hypothetical protein